VENSSPASLKFQEETLQGNSKEQAGNSGLEMKGMVEVSAIEDRGKTKIVKTSEGDIETKISHNSFRNYPKKARSKQGNLNLPEEGFHIALPVDGFFFQG